jgi:hypothetical protein
MRPDMVKVIVERERTGHIRNYHLARHKKKFNPKDLEEAVTHEGMAVRHKYFYGDAKSLNENLSPLKGFLRSRVGKPWNKVYSELNAFVNPKNPVQMHIRQHVNGYVALHVHKDRYGNYYRDSPWVGRILFKVGELYVNHEGILCEAKAPKQKTKLLPGQKLYTLYWRATHRDTEYPQPGRWVCKLECVPHVNYLKFGPSKYVIHAMTFIACRREDIEAAKKEVSAYTVRYIKE